GDPDFSMEVTGGASDDRFNFDGLVRKDSVTIDGEGGSNTVELTTTTGEEVSGSPSLTAAQTAFAGFDNIDNLVVAGNSDTIQDVVEGNMLGLETITVATGNNNTTIRNLEADTDVAISGKNQTAGTGNSNNDQLFGDIVIEDAQGDAVTVGLENTARADGHLQVGTLYFDGGETESVIIDSAATSERDQTNSIQDFQGSDVNEIDVTGTQDLAMGVSGGGTGKVSVSELSAIDFDASALSGDMALALDADLLTSGDSFVGSDAPDSNDTIAFSGFLAEREFDADAGSDGQNVFVDNDDELTLGSNSGVNNGINAAAPTITNIENIWFGTTTTTDLDLGAFANGDPVETLGTPAGGFFSAANVSGQDAFILGDLDNDFALTDLSSNVIIDVDAFSKGSFTNGVFDSSGEDDDADIWLSAEDPDDSTLDLEMVARDDNGGQVDEDTFLLGYGKEGYGSTDYGGTIHINDFDDVNLATGYHGDKGTAGEFDGDSQVVFNKIVLNDDLRDLYSANDDDFDDEIATDRDSVTLNIDNSVVGDGSYTVNNLEVVRTGQLNITAVGAASYMFANVAAAETTDVNLTADGDLIASFSDLLSNGTPPNDGEFVTLDASGVDGDASITIQEGVLERGATDTLIGSSTENDLLTFEGDVDGLETTVEGFETIAFDEDAEGTVNTANFSGVNLYSIEDLGGAITLNNLGSTANVELTAGVDGNDVTLNSGSSDTINVTFNDVEDDEGDAYDGNLTIGNYENINLEMGTNEDNDVDYDFNLFLDGDARSLNITGGDEDDSLDLSGEDLPASLTTIDVSDYEGFFTASMSEEFFGTDVDVIVGDGDITFTMAIQPDLGIPTSEETGTSTNIDPDDFGTFGPNSDVDFVLEVNHTNNPPGPGSTPGTDTFTIGAGDIDPGTSWADFFENSLDGLVEGNTSLEYNNASGELEISVDGNFRSLDDYEVTNTEANGVILSDYNTSFSFTDESGDDNNPSTWTIDNFIGFDGSNNQNFTKLDVSDLGITERDELNFEQDGDDLIIRSDEQVDAGEVTWEIVLTDFSSETEVTSSETFNF
ncbi:MAG: hypothetical protein LC687_01200, partial [Actinobacteria bacterium]|nr:hypothetical protein [Actinomycetota bacterium]